MFLAAVGLYGLAGWFWWRANTPNYLVAILGGQLATLLSPIWQLLYQFSYYPEYSSLLTLFERPLPWVVFFAGWISVLPPLIAFLLYQVRIWTPSYLSSFLAYAVFLGYFLLVEILGTRIQIWGYTGEVTLPLGLTVTFLSALMHSLVALIMLSLLILTRRYAWLSLMTLLLPMPFLAALLVHGLLGAPMYTVILLRTQLDIQVEQWAGTIGMLGTLGLIGAGIHTVASVLANQRD
jgi:hypothetical protein